jgi:putative ABC transport system permease protein
MKAYDSIELAARNLRESILRNGLTTLGIGVGVASLVAMLSLGIGLQQMANRRLGRSGLFDTIIVYQQRPEMDGPGGRRGGRGGTPPAAAPANPGAEPRSVDENARQEIAKIHGVLEVDPQIRFAAEIHSPDEPADPTGKTPPHFSGVSAVPMSARTTETFDTLQGTFFSAPDASETILQTDFAKRISPDPAKLIGKEITLRYAERQAQQQPSPDEAIVGAFNVVAKEKKLKVVGLVEREPFGGGPIVGGGARVFIPQKLAESLRTVQPTDIRDVMSNSASQTYSALIVHLDKPEYVQAVEDNIKKMGLGTWSLLDASRNLQRFFAILDAFLGIFGSLALIVASLGIVNTLVMAILERRREIGIMKAIGASDGDVKGLFFAEAATMGVLGGTLGVFIGWLIGRIINAGTNIYLSRQQLPTENFWSVPWWLVVAAIGFGAIVSLISGLYPASRASKLNPVEALRYE